MGIKRIFLAIVVLSIACVNQKELSLDHHEYISFGSLGGFAGSFREFRIYPDGNAFKRTKYNGDFTKQKKIDQRRVDQFYVLVDQMRKEGLSINESGNVSYFIKWVKKNNTRIEVIWNDNITVDEKLPLLYQSMKKSCSDEFSVR